MSANRVDMKGLRNHQYVYSAKAIDRNPRQLEIEFELHKGIRAKIEIWLNSNYLKSPPAFVRFYEPIPYHLNINPKDGRLNSGILIEKGWEEDVAIKKVSFLIDYLRHIFVHAEPNCGATNDLHTEYNSNFQTYKSKYQQWVRKNGNGRDIPEPSFTPSNQDDDDEEEGFPDPNDYQNY